MIMLANIVILICFKADEMAQFSEQMKLLNLVLQVIVLNFLSRRLVALHSRPVHLQKGLPWQSSVDT